jgi:hypothetical protein
MLDFSTRTDELRKMSPGYLYFCRAESVCSIYISDICSFETSTDPNTFA